MARLFFCIVLMFASSVAMAQDKSRVLVLTDISNEPDDEQSLVRFLVYSNEYDVEGLVATTSTWLRNGTREDLIRRQIDAYSRVRDNLLVHADGYPTAEHLRSVTFTGQPGFGMQAVGKGKSTSGSRHLIAAVDKTDDRPLWVSVWGGANTLAQALFDVRGNRTPAELKAFIARLRVYTISDQDDAGPWIRREFPELFYLATPSQPDELEYWRATWSGISGDRWYKNGPMHHFELVDNPWLEANIMRDHGALGALYPKVAYIMEGDTPSFLGLIRNGLGWNESPGNGGWGGRYVMYRPAGESRAFWTNNQKSRDTVIAANGASTISDQATIWRWREHYQNDFAARMDWCVAAEREQANHNPLLVLNGDTSKRVLTLTAKGGSSIALTAHQSSDPDDDAMSLRWWIYEEAGSLSGATLSSSQGIETRLTIPRVEQPQTLHVILEARDSGSPALFAYRRAVIEVTP